MVIKTKSFQVKAQADGKSQLKPAGRVLRRDGNKSGGDASGPRQSTAQPKLLKKERLVVRVPPEPAEDVIDLAPPRAPRRRPGVPVHTPRHYSYTPNPRLYSPPKPLAPKQQARGGGSRGGARDGARGGARARRRGAVRPPNPRLYRRAPAPAPRPGPPPPACPPAPGPLDTASRAALRLRAMDEAAPAELLAEFLSATLQRQYAAALDCCRRILHFEPHNATARAFYPLLCHRLSAERLQRQAQASDADSSAAGAAPVLDADSDDSESERSASDSCSTRPSSHSNRDSDGSSSASLVSLNTQASSSGGGGGRWSHNSSPDENGNEPDLMPADENDNGSSESATDISTQEDNALKQLRARFACSIK